jgi:uncharacterized Zn finger protein (UPF0148 family)
MKFCPSCGVELKTGARFCGTCGTPLQIDQPPQQAIPNYTPESSPDPYQQTAQQQGYQQDDSQQFYQQPYKHSMYGDTSSDSGLVSRAINMMTKPKNEWVNVLNETPVMQKLLTYAIILLLIPSICNFIAYGFIGVKMMGYTFKSPSMGLQQALSSFIGGFISIYLTAYVVNILATSFDSVKDFGRSLQLVVYSMTPFWVAGILYLIPGFQPVIFLIGIYAIALMYKGMPIVMRTPQHKAAGYLIVSIIVLIVIQVIVVLILGVILGVFFTSRMGAF